MDNLMQPTIHLFCHQQKSLSWRRISDVTLPHVCLTAWHGIAISAEASALHTLWEALVYTKDGPAWGTIALVPSTRTMSTSTKAQLWDRLWGQAFTNIIAATRTDVWERAETVWDDVNDALEHSDTLRSTIIDVSQVATQVRSTAYAAVSSNTWNKTWHEIGTKIGTAIWNAPNDAVYDNILRCTIAELTTSLIAP